VTLVLDTLASGTGVTMTIVVERTASWIITNTATVISGVPDHNPENNAATVETPALPLAPPPSGGGGGGGTAPTPTPTPTATPTPTSTPTPTPTPTPPLVPTSVSTSWGFIGGLTAAGIVIAGLLGYFLWRKSV
jgi:hypothetical protein